MRRNQRYMFFVFALASLCALFGVFAVGAQKKPEQTDKQGRTPVQQKETQQPAQQKDDEPVAITERTRIEKPLEARAIAGDEFGNFRPPIINNKGEVAFISL